MPNLCRYCGLSTWHPTWLTCDRPECRKERDKARTRESKRRKYAREKLERLTKKEDVLEMELPANQVEQ